MAHVKMHYRGALRNLPLVKLFLLRPVMLVRHRAAKIGNANQPMACDSPNMRVRKKSISSSLVLKPQSLQVLATSCAKRGSVFSGPVAPQADSSQAKFLQNVLWSATTYQRRAPKLFIQWTTPVKYSVIGRVASS